MAPKTVSLVVKYTDHEELWVEMGPKLDSTIINPCHVKKIEKDSKTNNLLQVNCGKCQESIQLNIYFYNTKYETDEKELGTSSKSLGDFEMVPFLKYEPEVVIKKEEIEDVEMGEDNEDFGNFTEDEDESTSGYTDKQEVEQTEEVDSDAKQTIFRRKYGNQEEIVTNFDLTKEMCDLCGFEKRKNSSVPFFLKHRAQHFIKKLSPTEYRCIACKSTFEKIEKIRFHTRTCPGLSSLVERLKSGTVKIKTANNVPRPLKIPEGVVLPDISKLKVPFYLCIDQPDGSKVWIEKTKTIKGMRISNFDSKELKCDLCGFEAKYRSMQIRHRKLHLFQQENDQKCLGCHNIFPTSDERVTHAYFCPKKNTVNILACSYCDHIAASYLQLRNHIGSTHGKNKESYGGNTFVMCHICSKEVRRSKMYSHLIRHNVSDGRPYSCAHCERRFSGRGALKCHLVKFHFKEFASFSCHLCPLVFKARQEYEKHLFSRHRIGKSAAIACTICKKVLANESSLSAHMTSQHTDASEKQKFDCPHCEKFFFKKRNLEAHIPTHLPENERPHKCWCGRGYATRDKLNRHHLEHTDPNKLLSVCTVCGKSMKSKQSLKVHMRIHTGM